MTALATAPPTTSIRSQTTVILTLFLLRWLAGILENLGVPHLSEVTATIMLATLALIFLQRMRVAKTAGLFCIGILAWIFSGALSYAANPGADIQATIMLLTLLTLYGLFANATATHLRHPSVLPNLARLMAIFISAGLALSLIQLATDTGFVAVGQATTQRTFGSDVHPVSFAIQTLAALVALEIIRLKSVRAPGPAHIALIAIGTLSIFLTLARTAWVMALIIIAAALILRGTLPRRITTATIASAIALTLALSSQRLTDLGSLPFFLANFSLHDVVFDWRYVDNSISWRIVNWSFGLQQALEQPWLGFGPGQSAVSSYFNLEMHNIFLEVFFEGGLIGLAALLITLAGLVRLHRHLPAANRTDARCRILANAFGVALFLAVTFSTSFVDQLMSFLLYMFLIAAAGVPTGKSPT